MKNIILKAKEIDEIKAKLQTDISPNTFDTHFEIDIKKLNTNKLLLINIVHGQNTSSFKVLLEKTKNLKK